jgi:hypothetical protein
MSTVREVARVLEAPGEVEMVEYKLNLQPHSLEGEVRARGWALIASFCLHLALCFADLGNEEAPLEHLKVILELRHGVVLLICNLVLSPVALMSIYSTFTFNLQWYVMAERRVRRSTMEVLESLDKAANGRWLFEVFEALQAEV